MEKRHRNIRKQTLRCVTFPGPSHNFRQLSAVQRLAERIEGATSPSRHCSGTDEIGAMTHCVGTGKKKQSCCDLNTERPSFDGSSGSTTVPVTAGRLAARSREQTRAAFNAGPEKCPQEGREIASR